jgi:hypothetical protein
MKSAPSFSEADADENNKKYEDPTINLATLSVLFSIS